MFWSIFQKKKTKTKAEQTKATFTFLLKPGQFGCADRAIKNTGTNLHSRKMIEDLKS